MLQKRLMPPLIRQQERGFVAASRLQSAFRIVQTGELYREVKYRSLARHALNPYLTSMPPDDFARLG